MKFKLLFLWIFIALMSCKAQVQTTAFPIIRQTKLTNCGPTCLQMIAKYYGRAIDLDMLEKLAIINNSSVSLAGLKQAADSIGLRTIAVKIPFQKLLDDAPLPAIVHWAGRHFVVVYDITETTVKVADPAIGLMTYSQQDFCKKWFQSKNIEPDEEKGIALLLEVTNKFYNLNK
jgi:ATP-binding cassette, subfamily B, bacterial